MQPRFVLSVAMLLVFGAWEPQLAQARTLALIEPPAGRVLHGWGQISGQWTWDDPHSVGDVGDLDDYLKVVGPERAPAMISFYVAPVEKQVSGFLRKYPLFVAAHEFSVAQIGLYFLDQELQQAVASGAADVQLRRLFAGLRAAGRPVLLRIGHEFNGQDAAYDPKLYIPAFRRVANLAREIAPRLIATVWAAEPAGFADREYRDWYPGDRFVDWWGLSLFFQEHMSDPRTETFMREAARRHKPVLIGESSPWFHGDRDRPVRGAASESEARGWFEAFFGFLRGHPQVKAVSVIIVDWRRWNTYFSRVPGGFPDVRLAPWPELASWYAGQVAAARFVHAAEARRMLVKP